MDFSEFLNSQRGIDGNDYIKWDRASHENIVLAYTKLYIDRFESESKLVKAGFKLIEEDLIIDLKAFLHMRVGYEVYQALVVFEEVGGWPNARILIKTPKNDLIFGVQFHGYLVKGVFLNGDFKGDKYDYEYRLLNSYFKNRL